MLTLNVDVGLNDDGFVTNDTSKVVVVDATKLKVNIEEASVQTIFLLFPLQLLAENVELKLISSGNYTNTLSNYATGYIRIL